MKSILSSGIKSRFLASPFFINSFYTAHFLRILYILYLLKIEVVV